MLAACWARDTMIRQDWAKDFILLCRKGQERDIRQLDIEEDLTEICDLMDDTCAEELADILVDRLGAILNSYPMPAVASGTLIPPRIEVDIDGLDAIDGKLSQIIDRMSNRGGSYSFTAQLNRRTLFQEVIQEAKIAQSTTGRNPFDLR